MAESTEFQRQVVAHVGHSPKTSSLHPGWRGLKRFVASAVFWRYERGSWQYDIICAAILVFVFLPRSWFHDRPQLQLSELRHAQGVVEVGHVKNEHTYQIDARLVESIIEDKSAGKPEEAIRIILQRRLKTVPVVKSFEPIRDSNNVILGYAVMVVQ